MASNNLQKCNALDQILGGQGKAQTLYECQQTLVRRDPHHMDDQSDEIDAWDEALKNYWKKPSAGQRHDPRAMKQDGTAWTEPAIIEVN